MSVEFWSISHKFLLSGVRYPAFLKYPFPLSCNVNYTVRNQWLLGVCIHFLTLWLVFEISLCGTLWMNMWKEFVFETIQFIKTINFLLSTWCCSTLIYFPVFTPLTSSPEPRKQLHKKNGLFWSNTDGNEILKLSAI